ncbi:acyltransferase [Paraglaciecola sp. L3A3]|uniref:acyltransferase family protein n=1 Tax=Paraglaciecola sp. L3A3 TaxID=2686358 RepID=UPI00131B2515|nr:acyltransferase [Paraglaciecola sp. L3A3]
MDNRNVSLDLLRAIAILMVFTGHTVLSFGSPDHLFPLRFGGTGVDLFFVLSGWLIGYQLFKEVKNFGGIDVKRFWIRRWMRTLPAYYAVLALTIAQQYLTKDNVDFPIEHLFFLQNYQQTISLFTVSWSLCVEEQFYLLIAPLIVLLTKTNKHNRTIILVILMLLPTVFRELNWYGDLKETHVRWDCCVMGVLLANIYYNHPEFWKKLLNAAGPLALITLLVYLSFYYFRWYPSEYITDPSKLGLAFIFGCWILWANKTHITFNKSINSIIYYISTRSYAIYLLHPEALALCKKIIIEQHFLVYLAIAFFISCFASEFLYRLLERPIMNMRDNFEVSSARNSTLIKE